MCIGKPGYAADVWLRKLTNYGRGKMQHFRTCEICGKKFWPVFKRPLCDACLEVLREGFEI